jgi:O-antigen ligase
MVALTGAIFAGSSILTQSIPWAPFIPLVLILCGLGAWLLLAAAYGSTTAIILYFAALVFIIDGMFRSRGAGEIATDWQSALKFMLWLGAGVIGFPHFPPLRVLLSRPACAALLAYIVVAMASSIYSPIPGYSFGCAVALLCLFAFSFAVTTRLSEAQIYWTLLLTLTLFNIGSWYVYYADPELGVSKAEWQAELTLGARMAGLAGQANNLGAVCQVAIGAAFLLWYTRLAKPITCLVLGGFAFYTLLKSNARTSEIAMVVSLGIIIVSRSAWLMTAGALIGSLAMLVPQLFPRVVDIAANLFSRTGDPSELYTLTGRIQIWDFSWKQIAVNPFLGYGYNSSKAVLGNYFGFGDELMVDTAHNLYLQNLLSVGIVGTIPLVALLAYLTYRIVIRPIPFAVYMVITILIMSVSDATPIGTTPSLTTLLFFITAVWPGLEGSPRRNVARQFAMVIARATGTRAVLSPAGWRI